MYNSGRKGKQSEEERIRRERMRRWMDKCLFSKGRRTRNRKTKHW